MSDGLEIDLQFLRLSLGGKIEHAQGVWDA
jgi:hypothetical protein